jgi:hypothetical protein
VDAFVNGGRQLGRAGGAGKPMAGPPWVHVGMARDGWEPEMAYSGRVSRCWP